MTKKRFKKQLMAMGVSRNVAERVSVSVANAKGCLSYEEHYTQLHLDIWKRVTRSLFFPAMLHLCAGYVKPYVNPHITDIDEASHLMALRMLGEPVLSEGFVIVTCQKSESD